MVDLMTQKQIDKLETRFERLDEKVDDLKFELVEVRSDIKMYAADVQKHVAGDEKIISEIVPILNQFRNFMDTDLRDLKTMAEYEKAKRIMQDQDKKKKAKLKTYLSIAAKVIAIVSVLAGLFFKF